MRVLQLGPYPPPHGGVQTNLVAIDAALLEGGHTSAVANITRHRRTGPEHVFYPQNSFELARYLVRRRFDIVHLHIGGHLSTRLLLLCLLCTVLPGVKTVLTFHSGGYASSPEGRSAGPRTLRAFVLRRLDAVIAVNTEVVRLFERLGVRRDRIRLIAPHAVDASRLNELRKQAILPPPFDAFFARHSPVLLTVGLLEPEYDLPLQLELLPRLRAAWSEAGLVIVGSGSLHADLADRINSSVVADHVVLAGDVPHDVTLHLIARADAFLRTTLFDGDSVAVREALCAGTPVVASNNGMRPNGVLLFSVGDLTGLEQAVGSALRAGKAPVAAADAGGAEPVLELYAELLENATNTLGSLVKAQRES
jgi:glycosyltransferase involved in cell wall biosynthesis